MAVDRSFFVVSTGVRSAFSGASLPTWVAERAEVLCRFAEDRRVFLVVDQMKRRKPCQKKTIACLLALHKKKTTTAIWPRTEKNENRKVCWYFVLFNRFSLPCGTFFCGSFSAFFNMVRHQRSLLIKIDDLKLAESLKTLWEIVVATVFKALGTTTRLRFRNKAWTPKWFFFGLCFPWRKLQRRKPVIFSIVHCEWGQNSTRRTFWRGFLPRNVQTLKVFGAVCTKCAIVKVPTAIALTRQVLAGHLLHGKTFATFWEEPPVK